MEARVTTTYSRNVLVKRRSGAASGGASLLAERTLTLCYMTFLRLLKINQPYKESKIGEATIEKYVMIANTK